MLSGCATASLSTPERSVDVRGRVLDPSGAPMHGVDVALGDTYRQPFIPVTRTRTDNDGHYRLRTAHLSTFGNVEIRVSSADSTAAFRAVGGHRVDVPDIRMWEPAPQARPAAAGDVEVSFAP